MTHRVRLAWYEHEIAAFVGILRTVESRRLNGANTVMTYTLNRRCEQQNIESVGAELAVAKLLNRYPRLGVNTPLDPDVGWNTEVRLTDHGGCLLLREKDHDDRRYVMVRGAMPDYEVIGFMLGADAKQDRYLANPNNHGPCYLVPESELKPISVGGGA